MPDGKKHDLPRPDHIEDQVVVRDELPKIIALPEFLLELLSKGQGFIGSNGALEKGSPRAWKSTEQGHDVVDKVFEEPLESALPSSPRNALMFARLEEKFSVKSGLIRLTAMP